MLVLLIVLSATNLATLAVLIWYLLRPGEHPSPDAALAASLAARSYPAVSTSSPRRVITIEILNAIELAGTRGRLVGIAGSFVPGLTRRVVYDRAIKLVRRQLADEQVVADVRLHIVEPVTTRPPTGRPPALPASVEHQATGVELDDVVTPPYDVGIVRRDDDDRPMTGNGDGVTST